MISLYLITDRSDIAEVVHECVDDHGDVDAVEVRAILDPACDRVVDHANFIDDDLVLFHHPIPAQLFAEVTDQPEAVEPIQHPPNHLVDIGVADYGTDFEGDGLGDYLDGVLDLQQRRSHGSFKFDGDPSDRKHGDANYENQTDDDGEPNHSPTLTMHKQGDDLDMRVMCG